MYPNANIYAFPRTKVTGCIKNVVYEQIDYIDEATIQILVSFVYDKSGAVNLVFIATGIFTITYPRYNA
ncbi:MAG: hypothetical protein AB8V10_02490 [Francisella endosymbiont of Hyalomma asiaticum]